MVAFALPSLPHRTVALLAQAPGSPPDGVSIIGELLVEFLATVVVLGILGGIVVLAAPRFSEEGVAYVRGRPVEAFVYGLGATIAILVAAVLLAITIIGLLVVIPGILVAAILGIVGTIVGVAVLGAALVSVGREAGTVATTTAFGVGLLAWALVDLVPLVGGLVTFVLGTMGFGYVVVYLLEGRSDDGGKLAAFRRERGDGGGSGGGGDGASGGPTSDTSRRDGREVRDDRFRNLAAADDDREDVAGGAGSDVAGGAGAGTESDAGADAENDRRE